MATLLPVQKTVTVAFQAPSGAPLAGGQVTFRLTYDISAGTATGPQICAGRTIAATLDGSGAATVDLWPNDTMVPAGSKYEVTAYSSFGQKVWFGEMTVIGDQASVLLLESGDDILLESGDEILLEVQ